ncbi:ABC transporter ATP-binding protein [Enterococcus casseliflavus]|uniref:ABC transporter ATP-binding protein n=1 Tax=Enterococcus casseliflavus TaxID=37734 RepID=UPI001883909E|nr:ABC transporter ATP-binding protein [Enterococcus casseliflavus]MBE9908970.1 ABC transporter ATP-binding protein [Enterococcus casseliflavus]
MTYLLEVKNLKKRFKKETILEDINLTVSPNEIVAFVGSNGAGKSTTFKTILDITHKDAGIIEFFGKKYSNKSTKEKEDIGVVFDSTNLPEILNIHEVNLIFKKFFSSWNEECFFKLIKEFSLPKNKKIRTFSRGMLMKLSVTVALSHNAKLLILDEVTSGLDPSSRQELLLKLCSFVKQSNGGILLSSHIMSDIEKIASRIVIIKNGKVILNETKSNLLENFFIVEVEREQLQLINKNQIIIKQEYESTIKLVVSSKNNLPSNSKVKKLSMDELGILVSRGEN